jgi:hypothetical protein
LLQLRVELALILDSKLNFVLDLGAEFGHHLLKLGVDYWGVPLGGHSNVL